jgi:UDP-N-acetylmuramoylalanine--D-glutamate ligase
MKIAIVGFGREGQSSLKYFGSNPENQITICDVNENIEVDEGVQTQLGANYLDNLDQFDLIIRSSGINPSLILDKNPGLRDKITTQLNEFLKVAPSKNVIGITGTKGKGTTSTLVKSILSEAGLDSVIGGNIGIPFLNLIDDIKDDTYVVLELSSFQLSDLREASPRIACCLMVAPEHLNWHKDLDDYIEAKANLFKNQSDGDIAIYFSDNELSSSIARNSSGKLIPYFKEPGAIVQDDRIYIDGNEICEIQEVKLLGKHNLQNVCAAITVVWQISKNFEVIRRVITSFDGLEHRLEFVKEVNEVKYYNDSFAAGLAASEAAVESIDGKKVMIIGGFDRMLNIEDFAYYANENQDQFSSILLIGESALRIKESLDKVGFKNYILGNNITSMKDIVKKASAVAKSGETVILSPGFASFDMFKDFEDRGNQFKEAVNSL